MSEDTQRIPGEEEVTDPNEFLNYFKPSQQEKPLIPPEEVFFFPVSFPTAVLSEHTQAEFYEQIARNWTYSGTADMRQTAAMIGGPDQWNVLVEDKDLKVRAQVAISASESYQSMLLYDPEPLVRRCLARYGTESIRIKLLNEGETDKEVLETIGTYAQDPNTISAVVRGADNLPEVLTSLMDRFNSDDLNRLAHHKNESVRVAAAMQGTSETCRTVLDRDLNALNRQLLEDHLSQLVEEERIQQQQEKDSLARSAMQTEQRIASSPEEWEQFLRFSARFYKYSFQEQIQIYAQRPNATACADVNTWVNRLYRHVVREENAIGLLAYDNEGLAVKYVFDVSDTDGATFPRLWEIRPEFVPAVISALAETNDITLLTLPETIEKSLKESIDNLIDTGNQLEYNQSRTFIKKSAAFIVNERCGLPTPTFSPEEFTFLESDEPSAVGTIICDASNNMLRQIERTVKKAVRERRSENEHLQDRLQRRESGSEERDHLRQERRLLDSEADSRSMGGRPTSDAMGTGKNEIPEGTPEMGSREENIRRESVQPLPGSTETGGRADGSPDEGAAESSRSNRRTENEGSHEVGGTHEQLQGQSRRDHQDRTDLRVTQFSSGLEQLSLFDSEEEQLNTIPERELYAKASGSLSVSMEEFDRILRSGPVSASHDLDCPWRPGDLEQRKGRIERQGNNNGNVRVYRYVTDGTFDSYLWQTVEKKQRFISQIMTSRSPTRTYEDTDSTAMSYAEIKALCAGSPLLKEKMELDTAVTKLQLLQSEHKKRKYQLEDAITQDIPAKIIKCKQHISGCLKDIKLRDSHPVPGEDFVGMELMGNHYSNAKEAGTALLMLKSVAKPNEDVRIGSYRGFELLIRLTNFGQIHTLMLKGSLSYPVQMGDSCHGNLIRIENVLADLEPKCEEYKAALQSAEIDLEQAKVDVKLPFAQEAELRSMEVRLSELNVLVDLDSREYHGEDSALRSFADRLYALTALYAPAELPEHSTPEQAKESLISCIKAGNSKAVEESIQKVLHGCPDSIKNEFDYLPEEATALITEYSKDPEQASEQRI